MIKIPVMNGEVTYVDEQTGVVLDRYRLAFNDAILDGNLVPEAEYNDIALNVLRALKIIELQDSGPDGTPKCYGVRSSKSPLTPGVFETLCEVLEGRVRAIKHGEGFFLSVPSPVWQRLARRLHWNKLREWNELRLVPGPESS